MLFFCLSIAAIITAGLAGILAVSKKAKENGHSRRWGLVQLILLAFALVAQVGALIVQQRSAHLHPLSRITVAAVLSLPKSDFDSAFYEYLPITSHQGLITIDGEKSGSTEREGEPKSITSVRNPQIALNLIVFKNPKIPGQSWIGSKENDLAVVFGNQSSGEDMKEEPVALDVSFDEDWSRVRIEARFEDRDRSSFERASDRIDTIEDLAGGQFVFSPNLTPRVTATGYDDRIAKVLEKAQVESIALRLNNGPQVTISKDQFKNAGSFYFYNLPSSRSEIVTKFIGPTR